MRYIKLTQLKWAYVDDEDYDYLSKLKWFADKVGGIWYAVRNGYRTVNGKRKRTRIKMHREILGLTYNDKICVDHKNRNGLDNRKKNLRLCTKQQNSFNRKPHKYKNRTSIYKGVSKVNSSCNREWVARIMNNGKSHYLGCFESERIAATVYNVAAKGLFGEFARINVLY